MPRFCTPADSPLLNEHFALCRIYAEAQERCSRHMAAQRAEVARLQDDVLRLRGQALVLTTALAWERADHAARPPAFAQGKCCQNQWRRAWRRLSVRPASARCWKAAWPKRTWRCARWGA